MAQYVTLDQAHNFEINGKTYDLIGMIEELDVSPDGWVCPTTVNELTVGQIVHVWARGKSRHGVVSKVAQHRATVTFMVPSEAEEALRSPGEAVAMVMDTAVHADMIRVPAPELPEEDYLADPENVGRILGGVAGPPAPENHTGSTVIKLLERVWARIREDHPELPEVVIITGSGLVGGSKWGHFRPEGWRVREEGVAIHRHELFLSGEALAKGARQVLQTMLHEGAHTLARVRGLQDTSRQGRWHNKVFRQMAEEMGLQHQSDKADTKRGFSFVTTTEDTAGRYADLLTELDREVRLTCHLPAWMGGSPEDESGDGERITGKSQVKAENKSGNLKAVCACPEPNIIRASRKVLDLDVIRCDECGNLFATS